MALELEEEIRLAIEKSLPKTTGEVLTKRLKEGEDAERALKTAKETNDHLRKQLSEAETKISKYQEFDIRNTEMDAREKSLQETERMLEIEKLKYELACEKDKTEFSKNVALGLVRNVQYRNSVFSNDTIPNPHYTDNNYSETLHSNNSTSEVKSVE